MKIVVFSTKPYDREFLEAANGASGHALTFLEARLDVETCGLARDHDAVCVFVNDDVSRAVLERLAGWDIELVLTRSAGFNHIDLPAARELGMRVGRVPAYSPWAVAEHAVALVLAANRKIHRAWNRVREGNFALNGLLGFDLHDKTVGVVGTGKIGKQFATIMLAFGCDVVAHDPSPDPDLASRPGVRVAPLDELFAVSDIISLHCPLTPETRHMIDRDAIARMKEGVMLVNTGRGALVDTRAVIDGLKSGRIGNLALDVYEEEEQYFFEDRSNVVLQDDVLARLMTFPNVLITAHQGFFTREALEKIAEVTIGNATAFESGKGELHAPG